MNLLIDTPGAYYPPYRFGDTWVTLGVGLAIDTFTGDASMNGPEEFSNTGGISGWNPGYYLDALYIIPHLTASQDAGQFLQIIPRATDPGTALDDNTEYTAQTDALTVMTSWLEGTTEKLCSPFCVELPVRAAWLGLRRHPNSGDTTREVTISLLGRIASSGTENRSRYQR